MSTTITRPTHDDRAAPWRVLGVEMAEGLRTPA